MSAITRNGCNIGFVAPNYSRSQISKAPNKKSKINQFIDDKIISLIR